MGMYKKFAIEMEMSGNLKKIINHWTTSGKNRALKKGLTKASKIPVRHFKKELLILRKVSDQSTGATHRSIASKGIFPSQGNKNYGYSYSGIDVHHEEMVERKPSFSGAGKVRQHIKKAKFAGVSTRINKKTGVKRVRAVKGYQKYLRHSHKSLTPRGKQKSVPNKYWHMINEGFVHKKTGTHFKGYHFDRISRSVSAAKMVRTLNKEMKVLFR